MNIKAYYNEYNRNAAAWLRELIKAGLIADGEVDERSIEDVVPNELIGFTQCHFFAGIGVWSYALRQAGWPDDRPVWTGSCPCQPFSTAGKGAGFVDERHLWPALFHLIAQCKPSVVFGEQVESQDGLSWLDLVQSDLESAGYAVAAVSSCAAGFGAPHVRQRLYWLADSSRTRKLRIIGDSTTQITEIRTQGNSKLIESQSISIVANSIGKRLQRRSINSEYKTKGLQPRNFRSSSMESEGLPCATNGFWYDADWLFCRDGKWRAVEPGTSPLVDGASARMGRLRGYGNAIVAPQAQAFIEAYMEIKK